MPVPVPEAARNAEYWAADGRACNSSITNACAMLDGAGQHAGKDMLVRIVSMLIRLSMDNFSPAASGTGTGTFTGARFRDAPQPLVG